ncbi:delta-1-pyrroline-5-carboxylate dehydrogenase [Chitinophaga costaii]|uniref:L-glutamate gamma-semialdehyde dehydrogenase n=1 Tax=Chitinophaga costaii TaxID=1335309 RepID=A0A1C4FD01_9BACT|nr:L-glutamate gamma-semialdehyde dehydrogenase [Chitinophaga costaii]PUZ20678.1 1-pyrroline-5-carboxylate dehydrogenase [Chitinophaga costaii]SCC53756.1 delta-1-pyrroline-5-carboxylate dehydrogenase [Chitinophaga costaii]
MHNAYFDFPAPANEPVYAYAPGSPEKAALKKQLAAFKASQADIPMYINGQEVRTGKTVDLHPPHEHQHKLGHFHFGDASHVNNAIKAALDARAQWAATPWEQRASIFLKAAELAAGKYRYHLNAATMLGQGKNAYQAEIDSACELIDFLRFNVHYVSEIYRQQPVSSAGVQNRVEYRGLEGFVLAITPFNFTAIAGNLPASAALCGNVVVWKPAETQVFAAYTFMQILLEAGLPAGVINLIYVDGPVLGDVVFKHPDFAGIHFTGSTGVFQQLWKTIGENIHRYKTYPRIVGETGGKDFVVAHKSADPAVVATALARGAFEYQGQKCSAASRAYLPSNIAPVVKELLVAQLKTMKMGSPEDFTNYINAVIDERSFNKITRYIDQAKQAEGVQIIAGGNYNKSVGYFIEPTVIETKDPKYVTMCEEIFGPVLTIHVYDENKFEEILEVVDSTSPYALTGSIIAQDRYAINLATDRLSNAAGNFYINDKPTGAVVGQQPFGGARASGTNDKAGSALNLHRWMSARAIKETLVPPTDYKYPFITEA